VSAATSTRWAFLSASGLQRAEVCAWAYAIDQAAEPEVVTTLDAEGEPVTDDTADESVDAARGTAIHAYLERVMGGTPRAAALALVPLDVAETCEGIRLDALPKGRPEVAYVLDVATGQAREIQRTEHRSYGALGPSEIPGTADLVVPATNNRGTPMVVDWKTGFEPVTPAADNLQLAFHALCVRALTGASEVAVAICRIAPDGRHAVDAHVLDAIELDTALERLRAVVAAIHAARTARVDGARPAVRESQHCKWCPAKPSCPSYAAEAATLARLDDGWTDSVRAQLANPADAAYWWQRIEKADHVLKEIRKLLRARVAQGAIPLPGGYEVREVPTARRRIDGKRALAVLRERFGNDVAEAAAEVKVSQKSLREACGDLSEEVMAALEADGAVTRFETTQIRRAKAR